MKSKNTKSEDAYYGVYHGKGNVNCVVKGWSNARRLIDHAPKCQQESADTWQQAEDWLDRVIATTPKVAVVRDGDDLVIDPASTDPDVLDRLQASGDVMLSDEAKALLKELFGPAQDDADDQEAE